MIADLDTIGEGRADHPTPAGDVSADTIDSDVLDALGVEATTAPARGHGTADTETTA